MPTTVQCECGHAIRVSREYSSVWALCPACGTRVPIGEVAAVGADALASPNSKPRFQCAACGGLFASDQVRRERERERIICLDCTVSQARSRMRAATFARWVFVIVLLAAAAVMFYYVALPKLRQTQPADPPPTIPANADK